ncbi:putative ribosomally synthesized peptide with SipW-like signal peptide [Pseudonocardia sediminis]|uniref:Putative ribosomally synthesized peptide with SipW-like signal peptide n=1 Tax=Pseudonocardia sediminis TaxID=1397368 RepID=A0A4Q7UWM1_PSEST|nr:TasA family protein [Pseudonocardia sediminis]RZT86362.1 putative ribosomally synthesized peptide with SipW-like signal peptide [Pseudonocardia sediminis]
MDTKKRIGIGVAALAVAALAIGLGTYAAFTDNEQGPGASIASGTLDLEVGSSGATTLLNESNIAPGFTKDTSISLRNAGSLPGTLSNKVTVSGSNVTCTEPEAEAEGVGISACAGNLQEQMTVSVLSGPGITAPTTPVKLAGLTSLPGGGNIKEDGGTAVYQLRFALPTSGSNVTDNKVQGDAVTVSSSFTLDQQT